MDERIDIAFDALVSEVLACTKCSRMCESKRVLNRGCGPLNSKILILGEAPGRLGADSSQLPFHGDKAGHNFESLIELAGLNRADLFITNAVLCNPKDEAGNNATPTRSEIQACALFLKRQINLLDPQIVVTLGATALRSTAEIENHQLDLRTAVRKSFKWYGRELVPLYHPGQRAMIHRSFANQTADYQFLAERISRIGKRRAVVHGKTKGEMALIARLILSGSKKEVSYFALHKLAFLAEYAYAKKYGARMTGGYFIRQKDGPYCVDLHPHRLKRAGVDINQDAKRANLQLPSITLTLFEPFEGIADPTAILVVNAVLARYGSLSDSQLKTACYLTSPMRSLLRRERSGSSQFNAPISFL